MPGDRPRWILHLQAQFWRVLMGIGMMLHRLARPLPPSPSFTKHVEATVSPLKGKFKLSFYVPKDYHRQKKLKGRRYPCVINFHGGGFTLGTAHDDARWAGVVVENVGAVVVSVDYRLAPEHPFPTAVEDGADAILYLAHNADHLMLDPDRFAVSGFSSGGNMSFTVPLCLQGELLDRTPTGSKIPNSHAGNVPVQVHVPTLTPVPTQQATPHRVSPSANPSLQKIATLQASSLRVSPSANPSLQQVPTLQVPGLQVPSSTNPSPNSSRVPLVRQKSRIDRIAMLRQTGVSSLSLVSSYKEGAAVNVVTQGSDSIVKIRGIVSFYPSTDYTQTREQRRQTCSRKDQELPAVFTELFDESYLQPPSLDLAHPWLSPGVAPESMLKMLPDDIVLFCCEWDMLLAEGERLRDRLVNDLGKRVQYHCVPGVPHGWDKAPNPIRESPGARQQYLVACKELKRMFDIEQDEYSE